MKNMVVDHRWPFSNKQDGTHYPEPLRVEDVIEIDYFKNQ
jgi:hypothetical protein